MGFVQMRVLITGGCGFVGRHFVCRMVNDGHQVWVVDNLSTGIDSSEWVTKPNTRFGINSFSFLRADLRDYFDWNDSDQFDLIIHCAAVVGGRLKIENDPLEVATDLAIDSDFFKWVVNGRPRGKLPKVIYFSSSAVYPIELQTMSCCPDLGESLVTFNTRRLGRPDATYGWSKLSGEYLAHVAVEKYGLDVKIYRPFGGYGEDQDFAYPFPSIIRRVLQGEDPVVVWGSGDQQRDFIHIDDVVEGVLSTVDRLMPGEVLNLGTGRGVSFKELANMACDILKHPAKVINDATKPEGVYRRVADPYKFRNMYEPKVWLEQGILRVGQYLEKALDGASASV